MGVSEIPDADAAGFYPIPPSSQGLYETNVSLIAISGLMK